MVADIPRWTERALAHPAARYSTSKERSPLSSCFQALSSKAKLQTYIRTSPPRIKMSSYQTITASGVIKTTSKPSLGTVGARPLQARDDLKSQGKNIKVVHFVRHAQGTHNVEANYRFVFLELWYCRRYLIRAESDAVGSVHKCSIAVCV